MASAPRPLAAPRTTPANTGPVRALVLLGRALRLRCPNCGHGRLLTSWFRLRERCPSCQVWLEREEGYFLGAMALNLVLGELLPAAGLVALLISTWPSPPWTLLQFGLPLAMGLCPVLLFPLSRTLWLAFDWTFNPPSTLDGRNHPRPS